MNANQVSGGTRVVGLSSMTFAPKEKQLQFLWVGFASMRRRRLVLGEGGARGEERVQLLNTAAGSDVGRSSGVYLGLAFTHQRGAHKRTQRGLTVACLVVDLCCIACALVGNELVWTGTELAPHQVNDILWGCVNALSGMHMLLLVVQVLDFVSYIRSKLQHQSDLHRMARGLPTLRVPNADAWIAFGRSYRMRLCLAEAVLLIPQSFPGINPEVSCALSECGTVVAPCCFCAMFCAMAQVFF